MVWVAGTAWLAVAAEPALLYRGSFRLDPKLTHPVAILGTMKVMGQSGKSESVTLELDQAVFGKTVYPSKEYWAAASPSNHLAFAYKLQYAPHKFYMAFIGDSVDGGITFQGVIYRADATLEDVQLTLSGGGGAPANWKVMGSAVLKSP
jgi:hypothetical protein